MPQKLKAQCHCEFDGGVYRKIPTIPEKALGSNEIKGFEVHLRSMAPMLGDWDAPKTESTVPQLDPSSSIKSILYVDVMAGCTGKSRQSRKRLWDQTKSKVSKFICVAGSSIPMLGDWDAPKTESTVPQLDPSSSIKSILYVDAYDIVGE
jgi:hypothetical protein